MNGAQIEGLAKVSDNLATAAVIALIAGGLVDQKIGWITTITLFTIFLGFLMFSIWLRKDVDDGN